MEGKERAMSHSSTLSEERKTAILGRVPNTVDSMQAMEMWMLDGGTRTLMGQEQANRRACSLLEEEDEARRKVSGIGVCAPIPGPGCVRCVDEGEWIEGVRYGSMGAVRNMYSGPVKVRRVHTWTTPFPEVL